MNVRADFRVKFPEDLESPPQLDAGAPVFDHVMARWDAALDRLERAWASSRHRAREAHMTREQQFEQRVQALTIQSAYWKNETEKRTKTAEAHALELSDLRVRVHAERNRIANLEAERAQWQEKAESWKEEARRSEEARIAALHSVGSAEVKTLACEAGESIDKAIEIVRAALEKRNLKIGA